MNSPSQEELIDLAAESGLMIVGDDFGNEFLWVDKETSIEAALAKFAQLLLQREWEEPPQIALHAAVTAAIHRDDLSEGFQECRFNRVMSGDESMPELHVDDMKRVVSAVASTLAQQPTAPGGEDLESALCFVYGMLWHVNNGLEAPAELGVTSISPELAAREARKYLLTLFQDKIKRGVGINKAREFISALTPSPAKEQL